MADYQALKTLIDSDPANATRTDAEVLTWLNEPSGIFEPRLLNARGLMAAVGADAGAAVLDKIEAAGANNSAVKWAAKFFVTDGIDLGNAETRSQLGRLATAGIITASERDSLLALARPLTRYEAIGWKAPGLGDVANARMF